MSPYLLLHPGSFHQAAWSPSLSLGKARSPTRAEAKQAEKKTKTDSITDRNPLESSALLCRLPCVSSGYILTRACMSYMVPRWSHMTLEDTCRPMFWLNLSRIQIMWKWRLTPTVRTHRQHNDNVQYSPNRSWKHNQYILAIDNTKIYFFLC